MKRYIRGNLLWPQINKNEHFVSTKIYVIIPHLFWLLLQGTLIVKVLTLFYEILNEIFVDFERNRDFKKYY